MKNFSVRQHTPRLSFCCPAYRSDVQRKSAYRRQPRNRVIRIFEWRFDWVATDGDFRRMDGYASRRLKMQSTDAKDSDQSDHNQIDRDDEIEKAGHNQNQNSGDQRNQRGEAQIDVHGETFRLGSDGQNCKSENGSAQDD